MKKLNLVLLLLIAALLESFSQNTFEIQEQQARHTALAFVQSRPQFRSDDLTLVSRSKIFVYDVGDHGFVIVSGDKVLPPILGYSFEGTFPSLEGAPEHFSSWIRHYEEMIDFAREKKLAPEPLVLGLWDKASRGVFGDRNASSIDPIITTHWNQDCFYNEYCPYTGGGGWWDGGPCGHAYAGCVACAMAQVMKYWNYPVQGFGSHSYIHPTYGVQSADFGATTYQWNQMPSEIFEHNDAVATLMYHCGVSVNMNYGPGGSGAQSASVETAFRSFFGYCGAKYREKSNYAHEVWIAMLKSELDLLHPMYYSGSSSSAGHAFVCDGYDNNDYFHFNFGWSGGGDSFYSLYDVNGYDSYQAVVMNVVPMEIRPDSNGIIYVSAEGEGNGSSWEQATRHLEFASYLSSGGNSCVWVRKGVYYGDDTDVENAFYITGNNRIYGGFNGDESPDYDLSQRDFVNNATILDGRGTKRVLNQAVLLNSSNHAVWDGFTIRNGYTSTGAGVYINGNVTLSHCDFQGNTATAFGGGVYVNSSNGTNQVLFNNCTFTGNTASMGGAFCDRNGSVLTNCVISNNTASTKGGGIYLYNNATPILRGCVIANNTAEEGGGIYARGTCQLFNCNIVMNKANQSYGGCFNENSRSHYTNCILWGNEANQSPDQNSGNCTFEYCAVQGGMDGEGNILLPAENDGDEPGVYVRFKQPAEGAGAEFSQANWNIYPRSICLNKGKMASAGYSVDLAGNPRVQHGCIDIGAYEKNASLTLIEDNIWEGQTYWFNSMPLHEEGYYTTVYHLPTFDSVVGLTLNVQLVTPELSEEMIPEGSSMDVYSLLGQYLGSIKSKRNLWKVPLKPGYYLLRIQTQDGILNKKVVIP